MVFVFFLYLLPEPKQSLSQIQVWASIQAPIFMFLIFLKKNLSNLFKTNLLYRSKKRRALLQPV